MSSVLPCYLQLHAQQQAEWSLVIRLEKTQQYSNTWPSRLPDQICKKIVSTYVQAEKSDAKPRMVKVRNLVPKFQVSSNAQTRSDSLLTNWQQVTYTAI